MTTVFPQMDFSRPARVDPAEIVRMVQTHQVTHMFGSPALLHRVGLYGEESDLELPTLKRVLSAGAPVSTKVLRRIAKMLGPDADIHTPYGATEALPVCSISSREVLREEGSAQGKGVCVGRPLPDVHLAAVRITDDPIEHWSDDLRVGEGEIGELVVWGPNVSSEYWGRKEANRQAKIQAPDQEIRHRMGDRSGIWTARDGSGSVAGNHIELSLLREHSSLFRAKVSTISIRKSTVVPWLELVGHPTSDRYCAWSWRSASTGKDQMF